MRPVAVLGDNRGELPHFLPDGASSMPQNPNITTPPPQPPVPPDGADCCGSGCNPCIFDVYEEAMERHRAALELWREKHG